MLLTTLAVADEIQALAYDPSGDVLVGRLWSDSANETVTVLYSGWSGAPAGRITVPGLDLGFAWMGVGRMVVSSDVRTNGLDFAATAPLPMFDKGFADIAARLDGSTVATWSAESGTTFWVPETCKPKVRETTCEPARWVRRKDAPVVAFPIRWLRDGGFVTTRTGPSGWELVRYDGAGVVSAGVPLPGPARLDVGSDGTVLAWEDGRSATWLVRSHDTGSALTPVEDVGLFGLGSLTAVDLSADGTVVAMGGGSGDVRVHRFTGGDASLTAGHTRIHAIACSPDGARVAVDSDGVAKVWRPAFDAAPTPSAAP
jgi:hypothetical protein